MFYCELLGSTAARCRGLASNTWGAAARVSPDENLNLAITFSEHELEAILSNKKADTTPRLDGFWSSLQDIGVS